jgi:hypothetical protein
MHEKMNRLQITGSQSYVCQVNNIFLLGNFFPRLYSPQNTRYTYYGTPTPKHTRIKKKHFTRSEWPFIIKNFRTTVVGYQQNNTGRCLPCNLTSTPVTFQVPSSCRPSSASWHHPQLRLFSIVRKRNERTENWVWGRKSTKKNIYIYHNREARKILGSLILSSCLNQAANQRESTAIRQAISFSTIGCSWKDYFNLIRTIPRWCNVHNAYQYFQSHPVLIYFAAEDQNRAR